MAVTFDDLIPSQRGGEPAAQPAASTGTLSFSDLIPTNGARRGGGRDHGIDFSRPVPEVRAAIAALPERQREDARRQWADAYVASERENNPAVRAGTNLPDAVRNVSRGTLFGAWLDEANAYTHDLLHRVSGGRMGSPYEEALAYQRATDRAIDRESPVTSTVTQVAGGLASGAPIIAGAKTLAGRMAMGGGVVGPLHAFVYGSGSSEGDADDRVRAGAAAVPLGVALGAALPVGIAGAARGAEAIREAASPTIARIGAQLEHLPRRIGIQASADAVPETPGARAAAEQIIANQLSRSGRSVQDLRTMLDEAGEATRFHSTGRAQDMLAPVDLDDSLRRLAGSVGRQSPEGADIASTFMRARQTGETPIGRPLDASSGIPHRPSMARPLSATETEKRFGSRFNTAADDPVPMGQFERVRDALKRAMLIENYRSHGHQRNAYRTEQAIIANARSEARELYDAAYSAGQNIDIRPAIKPVLDRWLRGDRLADEAVPDRNMVLRLVRLFEPGGDPISNLRRFDKTKQHIDGQIENFLESLAGKRKGVGALLTEFKNDMLAAVDRLPGVGERYAAARGAYASKMEMREALDLGRSVFRENADVVADQYRALTPGQQKLFRLGLMESFEQHMGRQKRSADITQVFENPRIQGILDAVIPRARSGSAEFANRPERFGRFLQSEKAMIATRNEVTGNSKTAQRLADDESFETLNSVFEQFRSSPSVINLGIKAAETAINKVFGMRADTAAAISRMLFTAQPHQRLMVLQAIEQRMGPSRMAVFNQAMRQIADEFGTPLAVRQLPPSSENPR